MPRKQPKQRKQNMQWAGEVVFSDLMLAYQGSSGENALHQHATVQLCFTRQGALTLSNQNGEQYTSAGFVIAPNTIHGISSSEVVAIVLIEPQSAVGQRLMEQYSGQAISPLSDTLLNALRQTSPLPEVVDFLNQSFSTKDSTLDPRLSEAIALLQDAPLDTSIEAVAKQVGLSPSRLRAIAKETLAAPLSKFMLWRAVRQAGIFLSEGQSLADAAYAAGFADQAHYTRTMKKLLGVTPAQGTQYLQKHRRFVQYSTTSD